jgi:hypothetical protein
MTAGDPASPPTGTPDFPTGSLVLIHSVRTNRSLNGKVRRWKKRVVVVLYEWCASTECTLLSGDARGR